MSNLQESAVDCPYCGEQISILLDPSDAWQSYIEDCQVCCRPITLNVSEDANSGELAVAVQRDDE